jgi:uracil phosphoribosyltransferase
MLDHIHVLSHPLVNTRLAKLREASTSPKEFREVKSITFVKAFNVPDYSAAGDP